MHNKKEKMWMQLKLSIATCILLMCFSISSHSADQCAIQAAECGVVRDGEGGSVDCGSCDSGETCLANRCEASCSLEQIDKGTFDDLFAYVPNQLTDTDLSPFRHGVQTSYVPASTNEVLEFPFVSRTNLSDKSIALNFGNASTNESITVSFKLIPSLDNQNETIMESNAFKMDDVDGFIVSRFFGNGGEVVVNNDQSALKTRSCNHFAAVVTNETVKTYFNGQSMQQSSNSVDLNALTDTLTVGPYPGKVWDVRVYNRELTSDELSTIGEDCHDELSRDTPYAEYPNYLCSVYQCVWWPEDVTDTTTDSFQYQVNAHDMTWEHNVLATGMYKHGDMCAELAKPRDLQLTDNYRKSWVSKYNYASPWNQYVLHENFHAYQSRTGGSTKFLAESSASWGAFSQKPTAYDTLLGMYTLQPHLPLWTTQSSPIAEGVIDAYKGGHQYGASIFEYYLTTYIAGDKLIGDVFNRASGSSPAQGMYDAVRAAGYDMRNVFSDFAAKTITWDYDYAETFIKSEEGSYRRMVSQNTGPDGEEGEPWPDEEVDNKIAAFYDSTGTGDQWATVPARYKIGSWAYNAYQVNVTSDETYSVSIRPSIDNADYAEFRSQVVLHNEQTGARTYYVMDAVEAGRDSTIKVYAQAGDTLYLVVSSTPSTQFDGWDTYTYDYKIHITQDNDDDDGENDDGESEGDDEGNGDDEDDGPKSLWELLIEWITQLIEWFKSVFGIGDGGGSDGDDDNQAPIAIDNSYVLNEGDQVNIQLQGTDDDADVLQYTIVSGPRYGSLSGEAPTVVYQPYIGFNGSDSFTFTANDGQIDSRSATISLTVNALEKKAKVFVMAGQSNMVGHGSNSALGSIDPTLSIQRDDVFAKNIIEGSRSLSGLTPGYGGRSSSFGVELKMGHVLGDVLSEDIYLFKASKGGTTLDNVDHWRPLDYGGTENNLYDQMIKGVEHFLQNDLSGKDAEIAGFIWFQGYNDTFGTENHYLEHLRNLLTAVRADLNQPDLPVVIVQINDIRGTAGDVVMAAQATVANEDPRNTLVITGDQRPYYHYGSDSYVVIGERIAHAVLPQIGYPAARGDVFTVNPGDTLNVIASAGVLDNDSGHDLSATITRDVAHGLLSFNNDGSFVYTPEFGYTGQDSFEYQLSSFGRVLSNKVSAQLWVRDSNNPLVLHYTFDNEDENDIVDSASGVKAEVVSGMVSFGHEGYGGYEGQAAYFDGSSVLHYWTSYPIVNFLSLSTNEDFSLSVWIKPEGSATDEQIILSNKYYYERNSGFAIMTGGENKSIKAYIGAYDQQNHKNTKINFAADNGIINDGQWHHIAVTLAFSANTMTLYLDGQPVGVASLEGLVGDIDKYESAVGDGSGGGDGNSNAFTGFMDELRLYRKALSADEVLQLAQ